MANGNLPAALLAAVPGQPAGSRLRVDACVSWVRFAAEVRARHGWTPTFTSAADAYRVYATQERIFRQRYRTYVTGIDPRGWDSDGDGVKETWWRLAPFAAAAVPGTSNHGWGVAVDITGLGGFTGTRYKQLAAVAARHGWDNNEGRPIGEAWHWVYKPERDTHPVTTPGTAVPVLNIPVPGGALPTPLEEDWLMGYTPQDIVRALLEAPLDLSDESVGGTLASIRKSTNRNITDEYILNGERLGEAVASIRKDLQNSDKVTRGQLMALQAAVAAQSTALDALATAKGIDPDVIRTEVRDALSRLSLTLTTEA